MPKLDGYEVAEFIKNDPTLKHIPVVLLTGAFEPVDDERARSVRCDGVLAKPFEPQLLIGRVKELLSGVTPSPAAPPAAEQPGPDDAPLFVVESAGPGEAGTAEGRLPAQPPVAAAGFEASAVDEDATVRFARPPALPEEDLRLDMESLEFPPEPPPAADASLDDYFDRLDAAFAHLTGGQSGRDAAAVPRPQAAEPWGAGVKVTSDWPPVHQASRPTDDRASAVPDPDRVRVDVSGPGPESGASSSPGDDLEVAAQAMSVAVPDAFSALLEAEREQGADVVHRGESRSVPAIVFQGPVVTKAFVDEVVRLVSERLGEAAIRGEVARIVSATAERLIREEIDRLKASLR
jgi:CheY-like chemotaxis protein